MTISKRTKRLFGIVGPILVVVVLFSAIYGPEIRKNFDIISPPSGFSFFSFISEYTGKEITVEGRYRERPFGDGYISGGGISPGTMSISTDGDFGLIEGNSYRFTGIYKKGIYSHLVVHKVEPVSLLGFFTKSTIIGMGIISIVVLLYSKKYIMGITLVGFILFIVGLLIMIAEIYPLTEVGSMQIGFFPIAWLLGGIGILILVFVLYRHIFRWFLK